jgi:hypothetical protein
MKQTVEDFGERIGDVTVDGFSRFIESPWFERINIGFLIFVWGLFSGYLYFRFQ